MREIVFPLVSLGSSALKNPDTADAAGFISTVKGNTADRITYELYAGIEAQRPSVTEITAGGDFYQPRIGEYLGVTDKTMTAELQMIRDSIAADLRTVKIKGLGFSLPAFSELDLRDNCFYDAEEFEAAGVEAYEILCRDLRDAGASRTILLGKNPGEQELETLRGRKYLWATSADSYEQVLEYSRDLVIEASAIGRLRDLFDSYEMRFLYLLDADKASLKEALKYFDKEYIFVAGYSLEDEREKYWKTLSEITIRLDNT